MVRLTPPTPPLFFAIGRSSWKLGKRPNESVRQAPLRARHALLFMRGHAQMTADESKPAGQAGSDWNVAALRSPHGIAEQFAEAPTRSWFGSRDGG